MTSCAGTFQLHLQPVMIKIGRRAVHCFANTPNELYVTVKFRADVGGQIKKKRSIL